MGITDLLFDNLVKNSSVLSPDVQREIALYGAKAKPPTLLAGLIARDDIDPELEHELSLRSEAVVIAAWASSPRRTPEELRARLATEKRVGALLPLAELRGLPEQLYREIAKVKSAKLTEALLENDSVPRDVRLEKMGEFVGRIKRATHAVTVRFEALIGEEEEFHQVAAQAARNASIIHKLINKGKLEQEHVEALIERADEYLPLGDYAETQSAELLIAKLLPHARTRAQKRLLLVHIDRIEKGCYGNPRSRPVFSRFRRLVEDEHSEIDRSLRELKAAADEDATRTLYAEAVSLCELDADRQALAGIVIGHRFLLEDLVIEQITNLDYTQYDTLCRRAVKEQSPSLLAELAVRRLPSRIGTDTAPPGFLEALLRVSAERGEELPSWLMSRGVYTADLAAATRLLPYRTLIEALGHDQGGAGPKLQQMLSDALGTDRRRWECFTALGEGHEGSLDELLATVKVLA